MPCISFTRSPPAAITSSAPLLGFIFPSQIFSYPVRLTWEFTAEKPIRSVLPLWPVYGLPMLLLRWVWSGSGGEDDVHPAVAYWTLRALMFVLSFVLEDWAIHELVQSPRNRRIAILLVASSYVTWTFQTHTFSNSIETLLVLWSLVLIQRIVDDKQHSPVFSSSVLACFTVFGIFNRITFPAFIVLPALRIIPVLVRKPLCLFCFFLSALLTCLLALAVDTSFYAPSSSPPLTLSALYTAPVIAPLNNLLYNVSPSNLSLHGLHPWYQHLLINLPQLFGPAYLLVFPSVVSHPTWRLSSALTGIVILSLFAHQEPRFLLPAVPLILSSVRLPSKRYLRPFLAVWVVFNLLMGVLMGTYHQGGVVPSQLFLATRQDATHAFWWRTYSPPIWLLDGKNEELTTHDLMGMQPDLMIEELRQYARCHGEGGEGTYLVAPTSATFLDQFRSAEQAVLANGKPKDRDAKGGSQELFLEPIWHYSKHLNLDDLDFADDGVWGTLSRVVGRRGLDTWRVTRDCENTLWKGFRTRK
ncbi:MAG: alpha 1,2 mannosyltransferase [Sclerophora amabilis]|nr:MAG: alpha 1,2 mannosyltransferase [Sclerophora amabilis]